MSDTIPHTLSAQGLTILLLPVHHVLHVLPSILHHFVTVSNRAHLSYEELEWRPPDALLLEVPYQPQRSVDKLQVRSHHKGGYK